jgi:murein DD-endopeptidase MepM/ murein hydrolase activator NlpD
MSLALPFKGDYEITQHFDEEPDPETHLLEAYRAYGVRAHDGVDFAVPPGTEIISVDDGEVVEVPPFAVAYGVTVVVQHGWGKSYYGHLSSKKVKVGDRVNKGDLVGLSGNTGLSTGPHLHFGIEPSDLDLNNGYLGKIDPLQSLSIKNKFKTSTKKLIWNISVKKGETVTIGYKIKLSDDDRYLLSGTRLTAKNKDGQTIHEDKNPWTYVVSHD